MVQMPNVFALIPAAFLVGAVFGLALGLALAAAWPYLPGIRLVWP